ncbi:recombination protein NinB [Bradyrhizobium sp. Tv2a-2]|uniref:recombination protein NinB n=1 Tax=Bradyrhizobium sp. Tv2a-2 TaxID=113395 RepID=UPI00046447F9|nr:recombination protein NinB [Bradyrhizobium sp. Tv2a-2]
MNRIGITIRGPSDRERVAELAKTLAVGMRVEVKPERRTGAQNDRFWAMLGDIAEQLPWHGIKLTDEDWKLIFLDALKREVRIVPNIDGNGFVNLSQSSSDLSVSEMSDCMELMAAFGANHGVIFKDSDSSDASPANGDRTKVPGGALSPPQSADPPGTNFIEASLLSDDWRHTYFAALTRPDDRKESLLAKHGLALQMLGGEPSERELMWMRLAFTAVKRRNEGQLLPEHFMQRKVELLEMPLPVVETAA